MLTIITSTVADGSMKQPLEGTTSSDANRFTFLSQHDILPENTTNVRLVYERSDYCRYATVSASLKGDGIARPSSIVVDGLVVTEPGHALFLPLADCIGAVIHDPNKNILMVTHLGRHNLEQNGALKSTRYLVERHHVRPAELTVWLSPAAGKANYPLFSFDNRSMQDVAAEQFVSAGVLPKNLTTINIDTTKDENYYSHSEFLKGNRKNDGRFAITAVMN